MPRAIRATNGSFLNIGRSTSTLPTNFGAHRFTNHETPPLARNRQLTDRLRYAKACCFKNFLQISQWSEPPKTQSFPRCYVSHTNRLNFQKNRCFAFNWRISCDSKSRRDRTDRQALAHPDRGPEDGSNCRIPALGKRQGSFAVGQAGLC